jgi:hypothetical protein
MTRLDITARDLRLGVGIRPQFLQRAPAFNRHHLRNYGATSSSSYDFRLPSWSAWRGVIRTSSRLTSGRAGSEHVDGQRLEIAGG